MTEFSADAPDARKAVGDCLAMVQAAYEAGNVAGIVIVYVGPTKPDDTTDIGVRCFAGGHHLDFVDDGCRWAIERLSKLNGVTPEFIRAERAKGVKGGS